MFDTVFVVGGSNDLSLFVYSAWILIPLLVSGVPVVAPTLKTFFARDRVGSVLMLLFVATTLLSSVVSRDPGRSVPYWCVTVMTLCVCAALYKGLGDHFLRVLQVYSVLGSLALLPVYIRGAIPGLFLGRLAINEYDHPNHLGRMCYTIIAASLAWPSTVLRLGIIGLMFAMLIATGSRASLLAAVVTLVVFGVAKARKVARRAILCAGLGLAVTGLALLQSGVVEDLSSVLALDSVDRGLGTGFTGRRELWGAMYDVALDHPLLGVGFRVSSETLPERFVTTLGSVHNGYLSALVEIGLLGILPLLALTALCGAKLWRGAMAGCPFDRVGLAMLAGYIVMSVFESVLLNVANPTAVLFWFLVVGYVLQETQQGRRGHDLPRGGVGAAGPCALPRPPRTRFAGVGALAARTGRVVS